MKHLILGILVGICSIHTLNALPTSTTAICTSLRPFANALSTTPHRSQNQVKRPSFGHPSLSGRRRETGKCFAANKDPKKDSSSKHPVSFPSMDAHDDNGFDFTTLAGLEEIQSLAKSSIKYYTTQKHLPNQYFQNWIGNKRVGTQLVRHACDASMKCSGDMVDIYVESLDSPTSSRNTRHSNTNKQRKNINMNMNIVPMEAFQNWHVPGLDINSPSQDATFGCLVLYLQRILRNMLSNANPSRIMIHSLDSEPETRVFAALCAVFLQNYAMDDGNGNGLGKNHVALMFWRNKWDDQTRNPIHAYFNRVSRNNAQEKGLIADLVLLESHHDNPSISTIPDDPNLLTIPSPTPTPFTPLTPPTPADYIHRLLSRAKQILSMNFQDQNKALVGWVMRLDTTKMQSSLINVLLDWETREYHY